MVRACAVLLWVALTAAGMSPSASRPSVRVFVYTAQAAGGTQSDDEKARLEAVREMRQALRGSGITLVDDRSQADVVVEVLEREQRDMGEGGFGGKTITPFVEIIIRLRVTSGDRQADLKGMGAGGRAAKDAADRVKKWIARTRPATPAKRSPA
jgi:hypothetical protein